MHRALAVILQVQRRFVVIERRLFRRVPTKQFQFGGLEVFCQLGKVAFRYLGLAGFPALIGRLRHARRLGGLGLSLGIHDPEMFQSIGRQWALPPVQNNYAHIYAYLLRPRKRACS